MNPTPTNVSELRGEIELIVRLAMQDEMLADPATRVRQRTARAARAAEAILATLSPPLPSLKEGDLTTEQQCEMVADASGWQQRALRAEAFFAPTDEERAAIRELAAEQELSEQAVMRQALRLYQLHHVRLKAGETMNFSGDAERAAEFAGVPLPSLEVERRALDLYASELERSGIVDDGLAHLTGAALDRDLTALRAIRAALSALPPLEDRREEAGR
jgi:hypothetical protein